MVDLVFAIVGCLHGELDQLYESLSKKEKENNIKIDLVLCCGDFQSVRNEEDLNCMVVMFEHHRHMRDFYKYYNGSKVAPYLTIFVGGNHEASNYLWSLPYGGWVAENIYYMGTSNVIEFSGIKIGGISGIYKKYDFYKGHFEDPPFNDKLMRSIYHLRAFDFKKLSQLKSVDIFLSHDWPKDIWEYGNVRELIKKRPDYRNIVENRELGCIELMDIITHLKPKKYFCAHKHVDFTAVVGHSTHKTEFLALDKSIPNKKYFDIIKIKSDINDKRLLYVPEWLALTKLYAPYFKVPANKIPSISLLNEEKIKKIIEKFSNLEIPSFNKKSILYDHQNV